jgi:hypothetical protein
MRCVPEASARLWSSESMWREPDRPPHARALDRHLVMTSAADAMNDEAAQHAEFRDREDRATPSAAIAGAVGGKHEGGRRLDCRSAPRRIDESQPSLPVRFPGPLPATREGEVGLRLGKHQMTIAAAREQAPGLRSGFRRKRREGMSVGECKPDVPARALLDRRDDECVARVDPGPRGFVAAEELRELAILQAEPVVVGPVRRALSIPTDRRFR